MVIRFNEVTSKDIQEVLVMMADFNALYNYPFYRELTEKNLEHFITNKDLGKLWNIHADGQSIGYLILTFGFSFEHGGRDAFIDELFLRPEYRHKGIGKQAMKFVDNEAKNLGIGVILLEVEQSNEEGARLYRGMGYRDNGRVLLSKKIREHKKQ